MCQASDELSCQQHPFAEEACRGLEFFREHDGARYCVLHHPTDDKVPEFDRVVQSKLDAQHFNFHSVRFPSGTKVHFANVAFTSAVFNAAVFCGEAKFFGASFEDAAYFGGVTFEAGASFSGATFKSIADFRGAKVRKRLDFTYATFATHLYLEGARTQAVDKFANPVFEDGASLSLYLSRIQMPERVSFRTLRLEPHWFVDTDARKFEFVNVRWDEKSMRDVVKELLYPRPHPLLSIAYRQLATNAEENHRFDEASTLRYGSMEALRLATHCGCAVWRLNWWYWLLSGYGERAGRASVVLFLFLALFAGAYTQVTFLQAERPAMKDFTKMAVYFHDRASGTAEPRRLDPRQAAVYSLECALLQKPDLKPATLAGRLLVAIETVLGPLQGALLALAVRRKFMK